MNAWWRGCSSREFEFEVENAMMGAGMFVECREVLGDTLIVLTM